MYPTREDSTGKRNLDSSTRRGITNTSVMGRYGGGYGKF